jgi:hypothetical protein
VRDAIEVIRRRREHLLQRISKLETAGTVRAAQYDRAEYAALGLALRAIHIHRTAMTTRERIGNEK